MSLRTRLPISAVSCSSVADLEALLNDLVVRGRVLFWGYIQHNAEDEFDRDHIHLYLIPAGYIDTLCLSPVVTGCCKCHSFSDWYLYNLHHQPYLSSMLITKKFHYKPSDFVWSDSSVANGMIRRFTINNERE